jgi:hypothetical protein
MLKLFRSTRAGVCAGLVMATLLSGAPRLSAEALPPLWGYGVKTCESYLSAAEGADPQVGEYRRYEDWLTGFVSGLNLATGQDVLLGADVGSAMRRIRAYCRGHAQEDFFTATMDLIRMLNRLR